MNWRLLLLLPREVRVRSERPYPTAAARGTAAVPRPPSSCSKRGGEAPLGATYALAADSTASSRVLLESSSRWLLLKRRWLLLLLLGRAAVAVAVHVHTASQG